MIQKDLNNYTVQNLERKKTMAASLRSLFIREARKALDRLEAGDCPDMTADQAAAALYFLTDEAISREEAANLTGDSLTTFAEKVKRGDLPQPKKRRGFKEKAWSKAELLLAIHKKRG